jgi:hypothetical protein
MILKDILASKASDVRIDLFLGIANWFLFLDHIPNDTINLLTIRNFGFSGAADAFIFISGYAASIGYANIMLERGTIVGATRVLRRAWQLYAAYVVLFAIYVVTIGDVATRFAAPEIINEFNVAALIDQPIRTVGHGLLLQSRALNLDVLKLYVVLMACFPAVLWMMLRRPGLTMAASIALYFAARQFEWNLSLFPDGSWYLNPFCWQLLFVLGAWCALGGIRGRQAILNSPIVLYFGIAYLAFALVMTLAGHVPELGDRLPRWLFDAFNPNDRTNLAPYRVLHFIVLACVVTRLLPKGWSGLHWPAIQPLILCGQQSLAVFCVAVLLSFLGHLVLVTGSGSLVEQMLVSISGIAIMTLVAGYVSWSKRQDRPVSGHTAPKSSPQVGDRTALASDLPRR